MTSPPVSWLYTLSMSTVIFVALFWFSSKNPSNWSALVATVQKGTDVPSMLIVVW